MDGGGDGRDAPRGARRRSSSGERVVGLDDFVDGAPPSSLYRDVDAPRGDRSRPPGQGRPVAAAALLRSIMDVGPGAAEDNGTERPGKSGNEDDPNGAAALASRTNGVLGDFRDYLEAIEEENPGLGLGLEGVVDYTPFDGGEDEGGGAVLRNWKRDGKKGGPQRRYVLEAPSNAFDIDEISFCVDNGGKGREKGYWHTHPALHSKKLKIWLVSLPVLSLLLVLLIGDSSGGKEVVDNEQMDVANQEHMDVATQGHMDVASTWPPVLEHNLSKAVDGEDEEKRSNVDAEIALGTDLTEQQRSIYKTTWEKYHPRKQGWDGGTYAAARDFCGTSKDSDICPFDAICPMGMASRPFSGYDDGRESWVPISDADNEWVSLSAEEGACIKFSEVYGSTPDWERGGADLGRGGAGGKGIAPHVLCCEAPGAVDGGRRDAPTPLPAALPSRKPALPTSTGAASATSESATAMARPSTLKYRLEWHDRSDGWAGRTHDEALSFCAGRGAGHALCPFEAICPSPNAVPNGGARDGGPGGSWAPIGDGPNEWVRLGGPGGASCVRFAERYGTGPAWGATGDDEAATRHVACCEETASVDAVDRPTVDPADRPSLDGQATGLGTQAVMEKYAPRWYRRGEMSAIEGGWIGKSYIDAISHCARHDSSIPCPYEAYCPNGAGNAPFGGSRVTQHAQEVWAPIMDIPNGWVNVGPSSNACKLYNSLHPHPPRWGLVGRRSEEARLQVHFDAEDVKAMTAHIMCCREPPEGDRTVALQSHAPSGPVPVAKTKYEQDILDKKHPVWFSGEHGYHGTTHEEAAAFCGNVGGMVLCPAETYCPQGNTDPDRPLFFQNPAFEGEQWAPVATTSTSLDEKWLLIGRIDGDSRSTCSTFGSVKGMLGGWDPNTGDPGLKKHVLCCLNPNLSLKETNFAKGLDRIWLDESSGWNGGSHDDAKELCKKLGANKKLCPYSAYCPHGPSKPVIGGHSVDFNTEGEQWAPAHRDSNYWVMIGQKYGNSATTCVDNWELEGKEPSWGMSNERADLKKHIMCCEY